VVLARNDDDVTFLNLNGNVFLEAEKRNALNYLHSIGGTVENDLIGVQREFLHFDTRAQVSDVVHVLAHVRRNHLQASLSYLSQ